MWEKIGNFIIYECSVCGNDIAISSAKPPDTCLYCSGEKISKEKMIEYLAERLSCEHWKCGKEKSCKNNYCANDKGYPNTKCWIALAKEEVKIKNGQG